MFANERLANIERIANWLIVQAKTDVAIRLEERLQRFPIVLADHDGGDGNEVNSAHNNALGLIDVIVNHCQGCSSLGRFVELVAEQDRSVAPKKSRAPG